MHDCFSDSINNRNIVCRYCNFLHQMQTGYLCQIHNRYANTHAERITARERR